MILLFLFCKGSICTYNSITYTPNPILHGPLITRNDIHNTWLDDSYVKNATLIDSNASQIIFENENEQNLFKINLSLIYKKCMINSLFFDNQTANYNIFRPYYDSSDINRITFCHVSNCGNLKNCGITCFKINIQKLFFIKYDTIVIFAKRTINLIKYSKTIKIFIFLLSYNVFFKNQGVLESHHETQEKSFFEFKVDYEKIFFLIKLELETFEKTYNEAIPNYNLCNKINLIQIFSILSKILFHLDSLFISCVSNNYVSSNYKKVLSYLHYLILNDKINEYAIDLYTQFLEKFLFLFSDNNEMNQKWLKLDLFCSIDYENNFFLNFKQLNGIFKQNTPFFETYRANYYAYCMFYHEDIDCVLVSKNLSNY